MTYAEIDFPPGLSRRSRLWLDFLTELDTIHREQVPLTADALPEEVWAGNVTYHTPRGWTIVVFNDCMSWDYIDDAITPDGVSLTRAFEASYVDGAMNGTVYCPTDDELERVWLFPRTHPGSV